MSAMCRKRHGVNIPARDIQLATVHRTFMARNTQSGCEGLIERIKKQGVISRMRP
jgi:hypothetical protein